ncbi:MAG: hypothetical protein ACR2QK_12930 [Acidimicrobiales bacterium]
MGDQNSGDHGNRRSDRCREHGVTADYYVPQLWRLLSGDAPARHVYYTFIDEIVGSDNPLDLFEGRRKRPGMYFIEALYLTHAEYGDEIARPSLAPLGYSRWVAWRRLRDVIKSGSVSFPGRLDEFIARSRGDVIRHVRSGWKPAVLPRDPELMELLEWC